MVALSGFILSVNLKINVVREKASVCFLVEVALVAALEEESPRSNLGMVRITTQKASF